MKTFTLAAPVINFSPALAVPRLPTSYKTFLMHLAAWVGYYLLEAGFVVLMGTRMPHLLESFLAFSVFAAFFYAHSLWLFPTYLARRRYVAYTLGLLLILALYGALRYFFTLHVLTPLKIDVMYAFTTLRAFLTVSYWRILQFIIYSFLYAYATYAISMQKQLRVQEKQLQEQERNLLEADIAFLKSQINPHFLFNALNFLYSQVYPLSESTAKSVLLLSDIMRYALNEGGEQGKVMLEKEVQHLRNYLALNQLRFGNNLQVQFDVTGNTQFLMILPLVLITFVENCFKHGELFDPAHPLVLRLQITENQLWLHTSNRKRLGPIEVSTGIGLDNTQRRLAAIYPDRHTLKIQETADTYVTDLHLAL